MKCIMKVVGVYIYHVGKKQLVVFVNCLHVKKINGDNYIANSSYSQKYMYPSRDNNWDIEN